MKNALGIVPGDYINIRVATLYAQPSNKKRKVRMIDEQGRAIVHFAGYTDFVVNDHEITSFTKGG